MGHLLLIDDDPGLLLEKVRHVFPPPAHQVEIAYTGAEGLDRIAAALPDVILLDLRLPDTSGLEVLSKIRQIDARIPVVFVTLTRSADSAIEAMKQGAYDYLLKPLDVKKLSSVIGEALKVARLMREPAFVTETPLGEDIPGEAIVGCCPAMQEVYKAIGRVADQTFPVLITGESGTGKELVARAVYQHGPRAKAPFSRSIARPSRSSCWRASCSGTRRARSPAPTGAASASSSSVTAARFFSMRSATCRW